MKDQDGKRRPHNKQMQRTSHGQDGGSPLICVFYRHRETAALCPANEDTESVGSLRTTRYGGSSMRPLRRRSGAAAL